MTGVQTCALPIFSHYYILPPPICFPTAIKWLPIKTKLPAHPPPSALCPLFLLLTSSARYPVVNHTRATGGPQEAQRSPPLSPHHLPPPLSQLICDYYGGTSTHGGMILSNKATLKPSLFLSAIRKRRATKLGDINSFQIKATCTAVSASIGKVKKKNVLMEISKKKIYHTLFTL